MKSVALTRPAVVALAKPMEPLFCPWPWRANLLRLAKVWLNIEAIRRYMSAYGVFT